MSKYIQFLIVSLFVMSSCRNNRIQIKSQIEKMARERVVIPFDSLVCIQSKMVVDNSTHYSNSKFKVVGFVDRNLCSGCKISEMTMWNKYMYLNKSISSAFVFESSSNNIEELRFFYEECGLDYPIYIDTCSVFKRANPFLPDNSIFHTMLLNEADSIILIGNPLNNTRIADLYKRLLSER